MMKKKLITVVLTATMALAISISSFAFTPVVGWKSEQLGDSIHWHYDKTGYGNFAVNEWLWIDGNGDGIAECYNFDGTSFMRMDTTTPDGYTVNADGAWTVDGVVQTKSVEAQNITQVENNVAPLDLFSTDPVAKKNTYFHKEYRAKVGGQLSNVIRLAEVADGYVEYYSGGTYTQFTANVYAPERLSDECEYILEVYGDNDNLLFESDTLNYKTSNKLIVVDITGQQYVKIVCHQTETSPSGNSGIVLKDAQFK